MSQSPRPVKAQLHKTSQTLELIYQSSEVYCLSAEFLRVHSPCAKVRVHSPCAKVRGHGNPTLQHGKQQVGIVAVKLVGNYALKLVFDDGHDTGLYDWEYIYYLCTNKSSLWHNYLQKLQSQGLGRDPNMSPIKWT